MRILLIEDDTVLGAAVRDQIAGDGQSVDWVTRLDAAGDALAGAAYARVGYPAVLVAAGAIACLAAVLFRRLLLRFETRPTSAGGDAGLA